MKRYYLKTGDPCPCCGEPIKTTDAHALYILSVIASCVDYDWPEEDAI